VFQLADGLLKLHVPGAGFLADIRKTMNAHRNVILTSARTFDLHCKHPQVTDEESARASINPHDDTKSEQILSEPS